VVLRCIDADAMRRSFFEVDEYAAGFSERFFRIDEYSPLSARDTMVFGGGRRNLSICEDDDKRNAICYESTHPREYVKARAVARILVGGRSACTGWLVDSRYGSRKNLLLTNAHCISTQSAVLNSDFEFLGEEDKCESTSGDCFLCDRGVIHDGAELLFSDAGHDVALIQLNDDVVDQQALYGSIELDDRDIVIGEAIYIPQHAGAKAKEIGLIDTFSTTNECKILGFRYGCTDNSVQDVRYTCDTEGGSSGSPVISRPGLKAVAIHHCGGRCNGNKGVPVKAFYPFIEDFIGPLASEA